MDPQETSEMCGVCHRTWETVVTMGLKGINTARFPAYRLTSSPCFSLQDRRIAWLMQPSSDAFVKWRKRIALRAT
jgi:hypothetical protein